MSLMERVNRIQGSEAKPQELSDEELFAELRRCMNAQLPSEVISAAANNPLRIENEIRSVCQTAFAQPQWLNVSCEQRQRVVRQLIDSVMGFGPLNSLLADPSVTEIMVNGPQDIYVERAGVIERAEVRFVDKEQIRSLMDRLQVLWVPVLMTRRTW